MLVDRVIVAIDPGKVLDRVWVTTGEGMVGERLSLPTSRSGVDRLVSVVAAESDPVFALEATGALHRAWAGELERRWPGSLRLFAPSQTQAARTQLGTRRFKTDDRDCAALVWLARQGGGQPPSDSAVDALRAAVSHRRQPILALKPLRQRLHDQLNALAPGLSALKGHGRALALETSTGRAVLACAVGFEGRPPSSRSLEARANGRMSDATARFWSTRWRDCLPPPSDAALRAARMGRDLARFDVLREDGLRRRPDRAPAGRQPRSRPHDVARRRDHSRGRLRRPHSARRALRDARAALLGDRPGACQLCILDRSPPRRHLAHRTARAPRRADRHRLGPGPVRARLPAARSSRCEAAAWRRCRPASRLLATPAGSAGDSFTPKQPYDDRRYDRARRDRGR